METNQLQLPEVAGRRVNRLNADMERAFLVCLAREQEKGDFADNALVATLCDDAAECWSRIPGTMRDAIDELMALQNGGDVPDAPLKSNE